MIYMSGTKRLNKRSKPLKRWKDGMNEYLKKALIERKVLKKLIGSVWIGRDECFSAMAISFSEASEASLTDGL